MYIKKERGQKTSFFISIYYFLVSLGGLVFLKSMAVIPAPKPIRTQTINKKSCAPEAIGELKISNSISRLF